MAKSTRVTSLKTESEIVENAVNSAAKTAEIVSRKTVNKLAKKVAKSWTDSEVRQIGLIDAVKILQDDSVMNLEQHRQMSLSLSDVHSKLDAIQNIQVNGRVGLRESLEDIYLATVSLRAKKTLTEATATLLQTTIFGKFLSTKFGKLIMISALSWTVLSILHTMGFPNLDPLNVIKAIYNFITNAI